MLLLKRSPWPGLLPIPPFAKGGTVIAARRWGETSADPFVVTLAMFNRQLRPVSMTLWANFGFNILGSGQVAVPNGAEFWGLSAPIPPAPSDPPELTDIGPNWLLFQVRWELHL